MKTYTVQLAFKQYYTASVRVRARDAEDACRKALASDCDSFDFQPSDYVGDTFVEAVGEGKTAWDGLTSALPIPKAYTEEEAA